ncbi:MAG: ATPase [Sphingomonadaceae bacterium]|nr:ATPase [Sphingomonadaceae bacterium]
MHRIGLWIWAGAAMAAPAHSSVTATSDNGFATQSSVEIVGDADAVYALLIMPARWWNGAHSYSGDAGNMQMDARAGGCFCETLPGPSGQAGSVEHGRVIYAAPGKRLRLSAALGPLQSEGVTGTLDFAIIPVGKRVRVTMTYVVGGYLRSDPATMAPLVDTVLTDQLQGLKRAAERRVP